MQNINGPHSAEQEKVEQRNVLALHDKAKLRLSIYTAKLPGVPKNGSDVWWNTEKMCLNLTISIHSSYMLDIST